MSTTTPASESPVLEQITAGDPETRSADIVAGNVERLRRLFPEAFTEDGIDFDTLQQLLGGAVAEREEKYGLNWHGKRQARQIALIPSTGTLIPCPEESVDWDTTRNLIIEGDNLEVLKLLQKSYAGTVKLIYIDPPYNTGKDFVYRDDYRDNMRNYLEMTGQVDGEGRKTSSNTEASGRFHTDWLNMLYPRLKLARNLLKSTGVILISIDDHEVHNLRAVAEEIFGSENFVACLLWEKGRKNDAKLVSVGHEYLLVFARDRAHLAESGVTWREAKPGAREIQGEYLRLREQCGNDTTAIEEHLRSFYEQLPRSHPAKKHSRYNKVDDRGVWRDHDISWPGGGGPTYDVAHPSTGKPCAVPPAGWRYSTMEKMQEKIDEGRVVFREDHTEPPIRKTYLVRLGEDEEDSEGGEADDLAIQVAGSYFYRSGLPASSELTRLFRGKMFDNPKDHEVLSRWFGYMGAFDGGEIVVDFFAGSGSTAHAVMASCALGAASTRFILVQLPEVIDGNDSVSKRATAFLHSCGKPANIAELTKERVRRAASSLRLTAENLIADLGFRVFKLAPSNIRAWDPDREELEASLFTHAEHILSDRTEQDVLYELLLKLGLDLAVPIEQRTIAGKTVHSVGGGVLLVCLADSVARDEVEALALGMVAWHAELAPVGESQVVVRDSAFADDVARTNLAAILVQNGLERVRSL